MSLPGGFVVDSDAAAGEIQEILHHGNNVYPNEREITAQPLAAKYASTFQLGVESTHVHAACRARIMRKCRKDTGDSLMVNSADGHWFGNVDRHRKSLSKYPFDRVDLRQMKTVQLQVQDLPTFAIQTPVRAGRMERHGICFMTLPPVPSQIPPNRDWVSRMQAPLSAGQPPKNLRQKSSEGG
jgi:hypothetical protein